jgi:hypothetical protein
VLHHREAAEAPLSEREDLERIIGTASPELRNHQNNAADRLMWLNEFIAEQQYALWVQSKEPNDATRWRHERLFVKAMELLTIYEHDLHAKYVLPIAFFVEVSREYEAQTHHRHEESVLDTVQRVHRWLYHAIESTYKQEESKLLSADRAYEAGRMQLSFSLDAEARNLIALDDILRDKYAYWTQHLQPDASANAEPEPAVTHGHAPDAEAGEEQQVEHEIPYHENKKSIKHASKETFKLITDELDDLNRRVRELETGGYT